MMDMNGNVDNDEKATFPFIICSWCGQVTDKPNKADQSIPSHGICEPCMKRLEVQR